ncbi:uncharacterized protein Z520_06023 [Fonsecaea multimorphosa CBS 102226]|uniref:Aflatoxin regulatory protein domain-containing protein n=1 Tax=Fonsecaea multimorphosa CBS 102226 TaxID=1442371 RepID=A0A0D2H7Z6_9EURO|nr:uncharacterized protein Z520_06023 [Fonsecaea multimorphosa CBS 102226]KIX97945.1 hypothetical protein Z520_06023 [Fonsecaea multimorphosa CBS 102226]OAL24319.1 hypothetical protein AYO22_05695 [Fonsecaea multimorphosa]
MGKPKKSLQAQRPASPPPGAQAFEHGRFAQQIQSRLSDIHRSPRPVSRKRLPSSASDPTLGSGFSSDDAVDARRKRKHFEVDLNLLCSLAPIKGDAVAGHARTPTETHEQPQHKRHQSYPSLVTPQSPIFSSLGPRFPPTPMLFDDLSTSLRLEDAFTKEQAPHDESDFLLTDWSAAYISKDQLGPTLSTNGESSPLSDLVADGTVSAAEEVAEGGMGAEPQRVGKEATTINECHCECVPRALHMASQLHDCLGTSQGDSLGIVLSTCRSAVELCRQSQDCKWSENHHGALLSINVAIMELVASCYVTITLGPSQLHSTVTLKFREMELEGFLSPHVIKAVVNSERKQAAATCIMLGSRCRGPQQRLWLDQFAQIFNGLAKSFAAYDAGQ